MKTMSYRLGRHKIIEHKNGELSWESYSGFAETRRGRCFISGDILFLEPHGETSEPGYLLMEYSDLLNALPRWTKTKYYCSGYTMRACKTAETPPHKDIAERTDGAASDVAGETAGSTGIKSEHPDDTKAISYRLARYKIVEKENGELWWEASGSFGRVKSGKCFIEGDILFIGAGEAEEPGPSKREFLVNLNRLPRWEKTKYYCSSYTMQTRETAETVPREGMAERPHEHTESASNAVTTKVARSGRIKSEHPTEISAKCKPHMHWNSKLIVSMGALVLFIGAVSFVVFADHDDHKEKRRWYQEVLDWDDDDDDDDRDHHRKDRKRSKKGGGKHYLTPVNNTTYQEACGACHFVYQPELLPSASWEKILAQLYDHFGEAIELDPESIEIIAKYLKSNGAEQSSAKRAVKITRSLGSQTPLRITDIPYIREKHHEVSPNVLKRESIGSLSNCPACHKTAEKGVYEDDYVKIPR